ncbi:MAG: glycosyltransferase family 4 protein [Thermoleophilia bacterium]|nr:glycosyltransferase family 4 protein [Thermoleophilia bacterium]MDH5281060.1 glycosyltransferase family 4 protein [Thermoleophilia bacterium]
MDEPPSDPRVLFLYRDSALRREGLASPEGAPARYSLFGLDELRASGMNARHNLVQECAPGRSARGAASLTNRALSVSGGYGGDFASVLACRREISAADLVLSTVDTLGLPLMLLQRARVIARTPVVYVSVGLLDRMSRLQRPGMLRRYREAVGLARAVIAYGHAEAAELREWLSPLPSAPPVHFVPFGVDTEAFVPLDLEPDVDVVSVGADPKRDLSMLARVARATPSLSYRVVAAPGQGAELTDLANAELRTGVPFAKIPRLLGSGRVVLLPVRENSYSGATTTLLQAMAMAKPVVVSRTSAISEGYALVDGETCRLVPPGDTASHGAAVRELLNDPAAAEELGRRARAHVTRALAWGAYVDRVRAVIVAAAT